MSPHDGPKEVWATARQSHHLAMLINTRSLATQIARQLPKRLHTGRARPNERFKCPGHAGCDIREADDDASVVNGRGCIPSVSTKITEIHRNAVIPQDGVFGTDATNGDAAISRNTNHLTAIVDRRSSTGAIPG